MERWGLYNPQCDQDAQGCDIDSGECVEELEGLGGLTSTSRGRGLAKLAMRALKVGFVTVGVAVSVMEAAAQGTVLLQNNVGAVIWLVVGWDNSFASSVQVHLFDPSKPGGIGLQVGGRATIAANHRFTLGVVEIPGIPAGQIATLILQFWNESADPNGVGRSYPFRTPPLGGDPDGEGPALPIPPPHMLGDMQGPFSLSPALDCWVFESETIDGTYTLVAPALCNPLGGSIRFTTPTGMRFYRLVSPDRAYKIMHLGAAPELPPFPYMPGVSRILHD